ncbi:MAG: SUMF1/EgtB/PvdO family nonheme iron enzyme [Verrucomicrobiota bacterium]
MRPIVREFLMLSLACSACISAQISAASERHALVIGNSAYEYSAPLRNPANDARKLAVALQQADFTVTLLLDGTHQQMDEGLRAFGRSLPEDSVALLFFAGHGMRVAGDSYLMPVDARAESASMLKHEAVSLEIALALLDKEGKGAGLKIVILDSCRNNPFGRNWSGTRAPGANTGMTAPALTPQGTVLCFATDPRATAEDGKGENSPYTTGLLKHLFTPGLELDLALREAGAEVQKLTNDRQNPWRNSNFNGEFAFVEEGGNEVVLSMEGTRAGEVRTFGGIEMVWCPPTGEEGFLMGSPENEEGRDENEEQHRVVLTKGFWLAKYEHVQGRVSSSYFKGSEDLPVEQVSWLDAYQIVIGYNAIMHPLPEGWQWRLPTEAQWEYACRAGRTTSYSFGDNEGELHKYGNFADNSIGGDGRDEYKDRVGTGAIVERCGLLRPIPSQEEQDDSVEYTAEVGTYLANDWGLHDMHGNVWEWCSDWYGKDYYKDGQRDPSGPEDGTVKVLRGGSWLSRPDSCRAANRGMKGPGSKFRDVGFRLAVVPSE